MYVCRFSGVTQNLQLHSGKGRVARPARPQKDSTVALRSGSILQAQHEVIVGVLGGQPASTLIPGNDALARAPGSGILSLLDRMPLRESLTVKKRFESFLAL